MLVSSIPCYASEIEATPGDAVFYSDQSGYPSYLVNATLNDIYVLLLVIVALLSLWIFWNVMRVAIRFALKWKL